MRTLLTPARTRFRGHRVRCFDGTRRELCRGEGLRGSSELQAAWLIRERGVSCAQASEDPKSAPDLAAQLGEGACG